MLVRLSSRRWRMWLRARTFFLTTTGPDHLVRRRLVAKKKRKKERKKKTSGGFSPQEGMAVYIYNFKQILKL